MHIQFICNGGIANFDLIFQTDTLELPKEKAKKLLDLIKQANLFSLKSSKAGVATTKGADAFSYQLRIEDGKEQKSFSFTDVTAPQEVRPLLDYLRNLAIAEKMKG
ncbi:protealysin inhibitor emfourin [Bacillus bingmayongensis]|uniref:protealysin inhibitor emfourin n=1 Tax=Bacillus bingmayongensis TaxID=1150157 RepID=UPI0002E8DC25|nr:protealysin inhibitor emfourin [Bacillus bingmayongensis]